MIKRIALMFVLLGAGVLLAPASLFGNPGDPVQEPPVKEQKEEKAATPKVNTKRIQDGQRRNTEGGAMAIDPKTVVTPAEIEAEKAKAAAKKAKGGAHSEEKSDALNQLGLNRTDLGIYTLIVFGILFFVLRRFAWGPIIEGLDKREALIKSAKDEAEKSLSETQKLRDELNASKAKGAEEVKAMIDEARRDAEALREKLKADATAEIAAERDRLRREIEAAKDQALSEIWGKAVSLATLISSKTVQKKLTDDDHRKLADESLADLKKNLNKAG